MFWYLVDRFDQIIGIGSLLLPFAGIAFGLWWHHRYRDQNDVTSAAGNAGLGCMGGATLGFVVFVFITCFAPSGFGERAIDGRARAYVIMTALGRYQVSHHALPDSLSALVPEYLAAPALIGPTVGNSAGDPFEYVRKNSTYVLTFQYTNPGINNCRISSVDRIWSCSRYF